MSRVAQLVRHRAAIVALAAAALHGGTAPRAWSQATGGPGGHGGAVGPAADTAHDRQGWSADRKADEAVSRATQAKDKLRAGLDKVRKGWCPKTRAEWDELIDAFACYLALRDLWRSLKDDTSDPAHTAFGDSFKGDRGRKMDALFQGAKQFVDDASATLHTCDKTYPAYMSAGLDDLVRIRAADKKAHELALIGMGPLLIVHCPECRRQGIGFAGAGGSVSGWLTAPAGSGAGGAATAVGGAAGSGGTGGSAQIGGLIAGEGGPGGGPAGGPGSPLAGTTIGGAGGNLVAPVTATSGSGAGGAATAVGGAGSSGGAGGSGGYVRGFFYPQAGAGGTATAVGGTAPATSGASPAGPAPTTAPPSAGQPSTQDGVAPVTGGTRR